MDLSYVNFWRDNHFSGSSRIETGLRTALGVDTAIHNPKLGFLQLFIGQIRSKRQNASFSYESGMSQKLSDYVLNVLWQPLNILDISYKARLSSKKLEHNYDELAFSGHLADTSWGIKYVSLLAYTTQDIVAKLAKYRQLEVNLSQSITKQWKVGGSVSKDLTKRSVIGITSGTRMIYLGGQVIYEGDCVGMVFSIKRDFTHYRDVKADTRWGFAIRLKTLNW
jgi:lipopolysaccharide assembly outer membrane protein LptD (OstA)